MNKRKRKKMEKKKINVSNLVKIMHKVCKKIRMPIWNGQEKLEIDNGDL